MSLALTVLQGFGVLAVLVGVVLALPLYGALVVDGVLVLLAAVAAEAVLTGRPSAPSDGRSASNGKEVS